MKIPTSLLKKIALGLTVATASSCGEQTEQTLVPEGTDTTILFPAQTDSLRLPDQHQTDSLLQSSDTLPEGFRPISAEYCPPCGMG